MLIGAGAGIACGQIGNMQRREQRGTRGIAHVRCALEIPGCAGGWRHGNHVQHQHIDVAGPRQDVIGWQAGARAAMAIGTTGSCARAAVAKAPM